MGKRGRPTYEEEKRIRHAILSLLPNDPPGSTFSEFVAKAEYMGISRKTAWRQLTKATKAGLIIHQGKFYRMNPLATYDLRSDPKLAVVTRGAGLWADSTVGFVPEDLAGRRQESAAHWLDVWRQTLTNEPPWNLKSPPGGFLPVVVISGMKELLTLYLRILRAALETRKLGVLREIVDVVWDEAKVTAAYNAKVAWELGRKKTSFAEVDKLKLDYVIYYKKTREELTDELVRLTLEDRNYPNHDKQCVD